jgi:hypothetical protein
VSSKLGAIFVCVCGREGASWRPQEILFSPLDCSLWTVKEEREREREGGGVEEEERPKANQPCCMRQGLIERTKEQGGGKDSAFAASTIAVR